MVQVSPLHSTDVVQGKGDMQLDIIVAMEIWISRATSSFYLLLKCGKLPYYTGRESVWIKSFPFSLTSFP